MNIFAYQKNKYLIAPTILVALTIFSALVMALWNALMPVLFNLQAIGFWQAMGLLVLSRLLFGIGRFHSPIGNFHTRENSLREKLSNMTPDERKEFFRKMRAMHHSWYDEAKKEVVTDDNGIPK